MTITMKFEYDNSVLVEVDEPSLVQREFVGGRFADCFTAANFAEASEMLKLRGWIK